MKKIQITVKFLNIFMFIYALLGIWLVINYLFIPANKDILFNLISRNYLFVLLGIISILKIIDTILKKVIPIIQPKMYSSKIVYDLGVFYFEFLTIIFLFPASGKSIKIILYFILRYLVISLIARKIKQKSTPSG